MAKTLICFSPSNLSVLWRFNRENTTDSNIVVPISHRNTNVTCQNKSRILKEQSSISGILFGESDEDPSFFIFHMHSNVEQLLATTLLQNAFIYLFLLRRIISKDSTIWYYLIKINKKDAFKYIK